MCIPTLTAPKATPLRRVRWLCRECKDSVRGLVRVAITRARQTDLYRYRIQPMDSHFDVAFRVERIESDGSAGPTYHVFLSNEQDGFCDCKGHEWYGHCGHIDMCRALLGR